MSPLSNQLFAEREGFEPPDPFESTVFKTAAFDHSATSPIRRIRIHESFKCAIFYISNKKWVTCTSIRYYYAGSEKLNWEDMLIS